MKKISKSKKGFTLVEMVLVIAIICILAAAMLVGLNDYINRAKNATAAMSSHNSDVASIVSEIDSATA